MGSLQIFQLTQSNRQLSLTAQKAPLSPELEEKLEPASRLMTSKGGERGVTFAEKSINQSEQQGRSSNNPSRLVEPTKLPSEFVITPETESHKQKQTPSCVKPFEVRQPVLPEKSQVSATKSSPRPVSKPATLSHTAFKSTPGTTSEVKSCV